MMQYSGIFKSPIGEILIKDNAKTILEVCFLDSPYTESLKQSPLTHFTIAQLQEYFMHKRKTFTLPIDPKGSIFQKQVWNLLCNIPYGTTRSYLNIALALHKKGATRAVGNANRKNPIAIIIPCHRVIRNNGDIGGYAFDKERKKALLQLESL